VQYHLDAVAFSDFHERSVEIFIRLKVSCRLQAAARAATQEQLDIVPPSRKLSSKLNRQFPGRLIGDKAHRIDWFAGGPSGDDYPHTLLLLNLNFEFETADLAVRERIAFCLRISSSSF
jgi:hypothetical protein